MALAVLPLATTAVVHLLHLLELVGCEDGLELLLSALVNGAHLLVALLRGERGVLAESGHLLLAVGEDRLELGRLVRGKVQALREHLGLALRVRLTMPEVLAGGGLSRVGGGRLLLALLSESGGSQKAKAECCRKKGAIHCSCSLLTAGE